MTLIIPSTDYTKDGHDDEFQRPLINRLSLTDELVASLANSNKLIAREYLKHGKLIGKGHFGQVFEGQLELPGKDSKQLVAIKTLNFNSSQESELFLKEALIMKEFNHPNVMTLIGLVFTESRRPCLVLPHMSNGDLLKYVKDESKSLRIGDILNFSLDIARGMEYLASQKFIHRDLAARNCMLDENLKVYVADFGLSKDIYEKGYYRSKETDLLPIKWMAPESINSLTFTTKSDVWSFAVCSWEIVSR